MYTNDDEQNHKPERRHWYFGKEINIAHLLTILGAMMALVFFQVNFQSNVERRLSLLEYIAQQQVVTNTRQEADRKEIVLKLDKIDDKTNRVLQQTVP